MTASPRRRWLTSRIEPLETRIAPAFLDVVAGVLTFTAGSGVANVLTVSTTGGNHSFSDTAETISLGAGATGAGFSGGGTNTVTGPAAAVSLINVLLDDGDDSLTLSGVADPITADTQAGTDTITVNSATLNAGAGAVSLTAETLTVSAAVSAGSTSFTADNMSINAAVTASGTATVRPVTPTRQIELGLNSAIRLALTDAELDFFTAATLAIGANASDTIDITAPISPGGTTTLILGTNTNINETAAGSITVANLALQNTNGGTFTLAQANNVATFAAANIGPITFANGTNALVVGTVAGITGINSDGDPIVLSVDTLDVQQAITSGGGLVSIQPVTASRQVRLGAEIVSLLSLTDPELDLVTANTLRIGSASTGFINVSAISPANVQTLSLIGPPGVQGAGGITVPRLAIDTSGGINIGGTAGDVDVFAANADSVVRLADTDDIMIGTVDGVTGIVAPGATIELNAGALTQAAGASITGFQLAIKGAGPVTLNDPNNSVTRFAATPTGAVSFTNLGALQLGGNSNFAEGVRTTDAPITINAGSSITVSDDFNGVDVDAGTSTVTLNAKAGDLLLAANSGIKGTGGVSLTADITTFFAGVNAGASVATVQPFTAGREIRLGAENGNAMSLTDPELDLITAGTLRIGNAAAGTITIGGATDTANTGTLSLITGGTVNGNSGITEANLRITAATGASLTAANNVGTLAIALSGASASATLLNRANSLVVGTVDGVSGITASGGVTLETNTLDIAQPIAAGTSAVTFGIFTPTRDTDLGTETAGKFSLTSTEIDRITAGSLTIDATNGGGIAITAPLAPAGTNVLRLNAGASGITETGAGALQVASLAAVSGGSVLLTNAANQVNALAGSTSAVGATFDFTTSSALTLGGTVAGASGLSLAAGASITGAGITQAATVVQTGAETATFHSTGGAITLADPANDFAGAVIFTHTGAATNDTIADANDLVLGAQAIAQLLTISAPGTVTQTGAFSGAGGLTFTDRGTLTLSATNTFTGTTQIDDGILAGSGALAGPLNVDADLVTPGASPGLISTGALTFASGVTFFVEIDGATPGTEHDQLAVTGAVALGGAALMGSASFAVPVGTEIVIIDNDGSGDAVSGTFAGMAEGDLIALGTSFFIITYTGGDGNDVALLPPPPLAVTLVNGGKSATYHDVDGDLVTVTTSKSAFTGAEFSGIELGPNGAGQLHALTLGAAFAGANITIKAARSADGGNGFANLGLLDATGVDLGAVTIIGDLARVLAGTVGGNAKVPAFKSLTVQSFGLLGTSTLGPTGDTQSEIHGALPKFTVKGDARISSFGVEDGDGKLGALQIAGSLLNSGNSFSLGSDAGIGSIKIGGDVRLGAGLVEPALGTRGAIGSFTVGGGIVVDPGSDPLIIGAFGKAKAPQSGLDTAIGSINVRGSVENVGISVGSFGLEKNADASIGKIFVGGDWFASAVLAGTSAGADLQIGTADDEKVSNPGGLRDNPAIFSTIGSFTVKGQAFGTTGATPDMFGVVAEKVGGAKVGGRKFAFTSGAAEAFFAAPTTEGAGTENPAFDFTIREIESATPTLAVGGFNLDISSDGKTATFTDGDGDLVKVVRSAGTFDMSDFNFASAPGSGGVLEQLVVTAAPNNAPVNLTITATPRPEGGNGFVNIGEIFAPNVPFGAVSIAGDVAAFTGGFTVPGKPGVGSFTAHSIGALGTTSANGVLFNFDQGLGKMSVAADVRNAQIQAAGAASVAKIGSVKIGGAFGVGAQTAQLFGPDSIDSVAIGGSASVAAIRSERGAIGTISIGGDLIGDGGTTISAFGQLTEPAKGLDAAIKSITVKGSVENARIEAGTGNSSSPDTNADAAIGAISVGREWLGSSVLAGVKAGQDNLIGTADDTKVTTAPVRDRAGIFSQIASITIKGQALGSIGSGDNFGIVAEQIGKAKVGKAVLKFDKGERDLTDTFALASDFFIREIVA